MTRRLRPSRARGGLTLLELTLVSVVIALVAGLAIVSYVKSAARARSVEAVTNLGAIREAQVLHRAAHGEYAEATDLPTINTSLDLQLTARHFDYQITSNDPASFLAIATSRQAAPGQQPLQVSLDQNGTLTYLWPNQPPAGAGAARRPGGSGGTGGAGGGGGGGSGGGSGISGGSGGGSGGGGTATSPGGSTDTGGSGGTGSTGGDGGSSGGGTEEPPAEEPPPTSGSPHPPEWQVDSPTPTEQALVDAATLILTSSGVTFDLFDFTLGATVTHAVSDVVAEIATRGVPILMGDLLDTAGALALVSYFVNGDGTVNFTFPISLIFDRSWLATVTAEMAATVLAHEGWHVNQLFNGTMDDFVNYPRVVDIEYEAFVAGAAVWDAVQGSQTEATLDAGSACVASGEALCKEILATDFGYPTGPRQS